MSESYQADRAQDGNPRAQAELYETREDLVGRATMLARPLA